LFTQLAVAAADQPAANKTAAADKTANPDTTFDRARFEKEVLNNKDLPNFHEVHPYLFRGGEPTEAGMEKLKEKNIATIIDLRGKSEKTAQEEEWARKLKFKYINLPMSSKPPTAKQVKTFMDAVSHAQKQGDAPVFVHCAHGSDRTGCMVGIWRVSKDGYSYDEAYKEMRHYWFTPKFTMLSGTVKEYAEGKSVSKSAPAQ
jgi:protein tyrosine/serine phosphatase